MNKIKFVEQALTDVLGKEIGSVEVIEQYFSPNYIQIVDGKKINYEEFVAHLKVLKEATNNISITIKSIAEGQDCVHTQHIAHAEKKERRCQVNLKYLPASIYLKGKSCVVKN
ncbi:Uncharacterised protein [Providencia stuartii]|nr:Uncharacterised protein [Providencia stuartii]